MRSTKIAVARVTLETTSPWTVGTGRGDDLIDAVCVTDANGLPAIPGSSLAGVLRHACAGGAERERANDLFGYQEWNKGAASRVRVSWAQVHDARNRPVPMRDVVPRATLPENEQAVLAFLEGGVVRDHVRLSHRGAVDGAGKFDERLVPRGARFTFELCVEGSGDSDPTSDLDFLLGVLCSSTVRLGGRTRRGYGAFTVIGVLARTFDLKRDFKAWATLPRALEVPVPKGVLTPKDLRSVPRAAAEGFVRGHLVLKPEDYWLFGNGDPSRASHRRGERSVDMVPKTEAILAWQNDRCAIVDGADAMNLVQSTGIKGALRHRAKFHRRRVTGTWADDASPDAGDAREDVIDAMFGVEKLAHEEGRPGRVIVNDAWLATAPAERPAGLPRDGALDHVSIDRYTGGPMDGMLFSEAPMYQGELRVELLLDAKRIAPEGREALRAAIDDLLQGRLAIGGGSGRGHGYVRGRIDGAALEAWLRGGADHGA